MDTPSRQTLPELQIDERNQPFLDGARRGELMLPRCTACGRLLTPPASNCTACLGEELAWEAVDGGGEIFSFIEYHRAWNPEFTPFVPYNVSIIALDAGVRLMSTVVGPGSDELRVGARVQVAFEARGDDGGNVVPVFTLAP
jgi:uncharacterized OB-fold protein